MARFQVGVQLHPQATTTDDLRRAWRAADDLGVDSIWVWDHFFPLYGDPEAGHLEAWTLLAAMAVETSNARFGTLVTGNSYRNPDLLADMARTVDHLSGGRLILGVGAGWFERDYQEYGYLFGTPGTRLRDLDESLRRIRARLQRLNPPPVGDIPILVGGGGEHVTLRIVAEQADLWNSFGPPDTFAHKNRVLDHWCERIDRDPATIQRTVAVQTPPSDGDIEAFLDAGAQHIIVGIGHPFDLDPIAQLVDAARR